MKIMDKIIKQAEELNHLINADERNVYLEVFGLSQNVKNEIKHIWKKSK